MSANYEPTADAALVSEQAQHFVSPRTPGAFLPSLAALMHPRLLLLKTHHAPS